MNFLQYEFDAGPGDIIQVNLDRQANVRLLDWNNFQKYRNGQQHTYYGGHATTSRINLRPPHQRSEEHTSELQSRENLVCRLLLEKKKIIKKTNFLLKKKHNDYSHQ